jgi:hypothetical protein
MKKETYFLRFKAKDYSYKEGDKAITFLINGKLVPINIKNVVCLTETNKKGETEFLIKLSKTEFEKLKALVGNLLTARVVHGTELIPPRIHIPPHHPTEIAEIFVAR